MRLPESRTLRSIIRLPTHYAYTSPLTYIYLPSALIKRFWQLYCITNILYSIHVFFKPPVYGVEPQIRNISYIFAFVPVRSGASGSDHFFRPASTTTKVSPVWQRPTAHPHPNSIHSPPPKGKYSPFPHAVLQLLTSNISACSSSSNRQENSVSCAR